ncbi:MAG: UDP-N-acetylmuramate--L-alanine ligase [Patescibacteria group bacterium]|nr:UDP-N-acetylmuramate--L-alanine ligase [Patescibacteria group bacterium]
MNLNLSKIKHVHFIGIGGIGISAIARMMIHEGKKVSGQDMQDSDVISALRSAGAEISIGQSYEAIPKDTDLIIYTIAIEVHDKNLFEKIKEQKNIPAYSYPQMLHIVSEGKYTIAISGTHGKTTTTAMIASILRDENIDPTVIVGSLLIGDKSNFIAGKSKYFVVEACEYRRSFLNINPKILVITNIDEDHLDYYKDINDIKNAFREIAMKVPKDGFIVCDPNDKNIKDVIADVPAEIVDYQDFFDKNQILKIPGIHNKKNAAAAKAVASLLSISKEDSDKDLSTFPGTWRRFEFKGTLPSGVLVYDDYAHHPVEIVATLEGFRELYPENEGWHITTVFQPHLFSRTKLLLKDFAKSFNQSDSVLILPIYYAREEDDGTISPAILAKEIMANNPNVLSFDNFKNAEEYLMSMVTNMNNKDVIITMGAGEAFKIGDNLLNK